VSEVDQVEARSVGREAARLAAAGHEDGSVAIERVESDPYQVEYRRVELTDVAGQTRHLPAEHLAGTNDIAESFREYAAPLVGPLPVAETLLS
jgi:6-phosphofructokinase 1